MSIGFFGSSEGTAWPLLAKVAFPDGHLRDVMEHDVMAHDVQSPPVPGPM